MSNTKRRNRPGHRRNLDLVRKFVMPRHSEPVPRQARCYGWRAWQVLVQDSVPVLASMTTREPLTGPVMDATCSRGHDHAAPAAGCWCGISVLPTLAALNAYLLRHSEATGSVLHAVTRVRYWGEVATGRDGGINHLRVAHVELSDVLVAVSDARPYGADLAERYGLPVLLGRHSDRRFITEDMLTLEIDWNRRGLVAPSHPVTQLEMPALQR